MGSFKGRKRQVENRRIFMVVRFSFSLSLFSFSLKHIQHHHPPLFIYIFSLSLAHPPLKYICCVYTTTSTEKKNFPHRRFCWCFSPSLSLCCFYFHSATAVLPACAFVILFFFGANHSPIFILSLIRVRTTTTKSSLVQLLLLLLSCVVYIFVCRRKLFN